MLNVVRTCFGLVVALKAAQLLARRVTVDGALAPDAWLVLPTCLLMVAGAIALVLDRRPRLGAAAVVASTVVLLGPLDAYNHHLYLIGVVAAVLVLDVQVSLLLRAQLTVVYLFGTLTKINDGFLSGTELHVSVVEHRVWQTLVGVDVPPAVLVAAAVTTVAVEGFLAVGFWFRRTRSTALVTGLALHAGMLVLISEHLTQLTNLVVYGTLMYVLYLPFFADRVDPWLARVRARSAGAQGTLVSA